MWTLKSKPLEKNLLPPRKKSYHPEINTTTTIWRGVPRIWQGWGARNIFSRFGKLHVAKPWAVLVGFGGMLHREHMLNGAIWCVLVYIWIRFCLQKNLNITIFWVIFLKIHVEIHITYSCTHMLGRSGAYTSCPEKILKMRSSLVRFGVYFDQIVSWKII